MSDLESINVNEIFIPNYMCGRFTIFFFACLKQIKVSSNVKNRVPSRHQMSQVIDRETLACHPNRTDIVIRLKYSLKLQKHPKNSFFLEKSLYALVGFYSLDFPHTSDNFSLHTIAFGCDSLGDFQYPITTQMIHMGFGHMTFGIIPRKSRVLN